MRLCDARKPPRGRAARGPLDASTDRLGWSPARVRLGWSRRTPRGEGRADRGRIEERDSHLIAGGSRQVGMGEVEGPTAMEDYLFDLRGYVILRQAITPQHVVRRAVDSLLHEPPAWDVLHCYDTRTPLLKNTREGSRTWLDRTDSCRVTVPMQPLMSTCPTAHRDYFK
jgi:hypothetical protein